MGDHRVHKGDEEEIVKDVGFEFTSFSDGARNDGGGGSCKGELEEPEVEFGSWEVYLEEVAMADEGVVPRVDPGGGGIRVSKGKGETSRIPTFVWCFC